MCQAVAVSLTLPHHSCSHVLNNLPPLITFFCYLSLMVTDRVQFEELKRHHKNVSCPYIILSTVFVQPKSVILSIYLFNMLATSVVC